MIPPRRRCFVSAACKRRRLSTRSRSGIGIGPTPLFGFLLAGAAIAAGGADDARWTVFVEAGRPVAVETAGPPWQRESEWLEAQGTGRELLAPVAIGSGDFEIRAKLRLLEQERSAAAFAIGAGTFGFEGARDEELFTDGGIFGSYRAIGRSAEYFSRGDWFLFEIERRAGTVEVRIDGCEALSIEGHPEALGDFALRPWRSRMQVSDFRGRGALVERPPRGFTVPVIDLASDRSRQVVVDREPGQYLGHPTTVLLEDGRTMIAVYPKGHGRGAIVMKRSDDGGKTWSDRLPVPESWATSKETPTIYRVIDKDGKRRLIIFSGLYPIRSTLSEDDGRTWTELEPIGDFGGIVAMSSLVRRANGDYMALFHDDGRFLANGGRATSFTVFKTISKDGGLTWGSPVPIARHPDAHLCEPGAVRSPDGHTIAVLLRENSRRHNSFVIYSDDEGETWSEPEELPGALTGDRHTAHYAPDGRLVISFRDRGLASPTWGDWAAWVGRFEDIVHGREGQYRLRLMDNHKDADCAYPAVDVLPDGTFVTTTYGHWTPGEPPWIASVRFRLADIDALAKGGADAGDEERP